MDSEDHSVRPIQTQTKTLPGKLNLTKDLKVKMLNKEQKCIRLFGFTFFHCIMKTKRIEESEECGIGNTIIADARRRYNSISINVYGVFSGCQAPQMHVFI